MITQFGNEHYSNNFRKQIKQKQHKMNKIIRRANIAMEKDDLWKGRFVCKQIDRRTGVWGDFSGTWIVFIIRVYDKATKKYFDYYLRPHWFCIYGQFSFDILNDVIVEKFKVWEEFPRPSIKDAIDYTKVKNDFDNYSPLFEDDWRNYSYVG